LPVTFSLKEGGRGGQRRMLGKKEKKGRTNPARIRKRTGRLSTPRMNLAKLGRKLVTVLAAKLKKKGGSTR